MCYKGGCSAIGVIQVIFFRFGVLFVQHGDGLFQLTLGAAALAHQRPHGLCEVAAKDGVQPLAHGVDEARRVTVGA